VEVTDSDKHSSLLRYGLNYDRKKVCDTGPSKPQNPSKMAIYHVPI